MDRDMDRDMDRRAARGGLGAVDGQRESSPRRIMRETEAVATRA